MVGGRNSGLGEIMREFKDWVVDLSEAQVRALSCQSGIKEWRNLQIDKLRKHVSCNCRAFQIYEQFGS